MVTWNARSPVIDAQTGGAKDTTWWTKRLVTFGFVCLLATRYSSTWFSDATVAAAFNGGAFTLAAIAIALAIQGFYILNERKPVWDALTDQQRKLIGLAPSSRGAPPPTIRAAAAPAREVLVTPPSRSARPFTQPVMMGEDVQPSPLRTPGSRGSARNVTPDQLRSFMQELDHHVDSATQTPPAQANEYAAFPSTTHVTTPGSANTYRPSAVARGSVATPIRSDGRVTQSVPAQRGSVMRELDVNEDTLEVGMENLREWFSSDLLQPLLAAIKTAHIDVIAGAAQLGFSGVRLTPLIDLGTENATRAAADDVQVLAQIRSRLEDFQRNPANANSPQLAKCMQDILNYQKLLLLLRGEFPAAGFMPAAPDGYIVRRVTELSNGSCMIDFKWDGGGEWNGKRWTAEMPTDSALLLYLFAAFLAAPLWIFTNEDPTRIETPSSILYLGKVPQRMSDGSHFVIPTRPPVGSKGTGILGLQLGTQQPHFCFVREGETLLTETGQNALFTAIALFIKYCRQHGGAIGGRSLDYLNLGSIGAPKSAFSLRRFKKAFRMW